MIFWIVLKRKKEQQADEIFAFIPSEICSVDQEISSATENYVWVYRISIS